jgi:hypothetical protein
MAKTSKSSKKQINVNVNASGCNCKSRRMGGCGGGYCVGAIGAAIYYISTATGFWMGVLGVLKALVWPAFVVFNLLKFLAA